MECSLKVKELDHKIAKFLKDSRDAAQRVSVFNCSLYICHWRPVEAYLLILLPIFSIYTLLHECVGSTGEYCTARAKECNDIL